MAIVFEHKQKNINWLTLFTTLFIIVFVLLGIYYLFFAATPIIETVLPGPLQKVNQISDLQFIDSSPLLGTLTSNNLQVYVGTPSIGLIGRTNPFASL